MKKNILLAFIFGIVSLSVSAQCTFTLTNASNDTTYIITSNTALSCINNPGLRSYLICPGVTVTYQDNSCSQKFYLEPGATLIYDTTSAMDTVTYMQRRDQQSTLMASR